MCPELASLSLVWLLIVPVTFLLGAYRIQNNNAEKIPRQNRLQTLITKSSAYSNQIGFYIIISSCNNKVKRRHYEWLKICNYL